MPPKKNKGGNKNKGKKTEQVPLEQIIRKLHHTENLAVGYVPNAINLTEIPNKGRGYVAAQDIPAGSLIHRSAGFIFSETFPDPNFLESIPESKRTSVKFLHHLLEQFEGPNSNLPPKIKAQLIRVFKTELHPRTLENFAGNQLAEAKLVADLYCNAVNITSERVKTDLVRFGLVAVMNSFQVHYNIAQHSSDDYGIFPSASFFNHSCYPNCTGFYSQKYDEYWINALVDIKAGEEVTIPYVDLYYPKRIRHDKLQLQYEFDCQCIKCLPVEQGGDKVQNRLDMCLETFLCPIESCKGLLVKSNHPEKAGKLLCDICSNLVDEEPYEKLYVDTFPKLFRETAIAYQIGDIEVARTKVDESIALLKSSRVHPYNTYMFQFYAMQANIYKKRVNQMLPNTDIPVDDRRRAAEEVIPILQATLNTARMIFPRNHPQLGHLLMDLGSVQSILGMEQEAQENIKKAHSTLKISRGEFLATKQLNDIFGGQPKKKIPAGKQRK